MTEPEPTKPAGVKDGASLSREWRQKGYHCQIWTDYKYVAGVVEGELVAHRSGVTVEWAVKQVQEDLSYRQHKWVKDGDSLGDDPPMQEYRCPFNRNRILTRDQITDHMIQAHPEKLFPEPMDT